MKKSLLAVLSSMLLLTSHYTFADCSNPGSKDAAPLNFDLSTELTSTTVPINKSTRTAFPGTFTCTTPAILQSNTVGINSPFSQSTVAIGFNGGKQIVSISVSNISPTSVSNIAVGSHPASDLDANFTVQFKLLSSPPGSNYKEIAGNTVLINPVMIAADVTSLGLVAWLLRLVSDLVTFILTLQWPTHPNDMFYQPMQITYNPVTTTCNFANQGLTVNLHPITIQNVKTNSLAGYTPFTLNFTCSGLVNGTNVSRDMAMFLASNNVLSTDNTVLTNTTVQGAAGVGFRMVRASSTGTPLIFSNSVSTQNSATNIFSVTSGSALSPSFSINMGAYYFPYNPNSVTKGAISSSATLVFSYN